MLCGVAVEVMRRIGFSISRTLNNKVTSPLQTLQFSSIQKRNIKCSTGEERAFPDMRKICYVITIEMAMRNNFSVSLQLKINVTALIQTLQFTSIQKRKNSNQFVMYAIFCAPAADFSLSERSKASLVYVFIIARDLRALHLEILFFQVGLGIPCWFKENMCYKIKETSVRKSWLKVRVRKQS